MEWYVKEKMVVIEKVVVLGGLDIVEMEDGEFIVVDKDGFFYIIVDLILFIMNKFDKDVVDRFVVDMCRVEEQILKKRKERMLKNGDDGDVMYINEKNKQFNQKLVRFYNKYIVEIRDSFECGMMI